MTKRKSFLRQSRKLRENIRKCIIPIYNYYTRLEKANSLTSITYMLL